MNPSPRVSVYRSRDSMVGKGVVSIIRERISGARWAAGKGLWWLIPREISVTWSSTLVCGAWLSQQWSGVCLSYTLRVVNSTLLALLSVLAPLIPSGDFPQKPIYGWSHSVDMDVLVTCVDILGMSPCQMRLL